MADEIDRLRDALHWCAGSPSFAPEGEAHKGWLKICAPLLGKTATKAPDLADEIADANVIRVHFNGYRWYAEVGPKDRGLLADGRTAAVALASLAVKCGSLGWPFDETWKPR